MLPARPRRVLETAVYASDLDAAAGFYGELLGLELVGRVEGRHCFFRCGEGMVLVFDPASTSVQPTSIGGAPIPLHGTRGAGHLAFAVPEAELPAWRARFAAGGIAVESEVAWPGGGRSLYVRDPAGNSVELASPRLWGMPEVEHDQSTESSRGSGPGS
jgi:catechol 2,3-dioxygenase-like lactoylglutathione lyase family enzyme